MSTAYADYLDKSTKKIIGIISDPDVEDTERESIVSAFSDELLNNIWNPDKLRDCDLLAYSVSVSHIDNKLSEIMSNNNTDYESGIILCERQQKLIQMFADKQWTLPHISNVQIDDCKRLFIERQGKCSITSKIIDEDKKIEKLIVRAQKELSISLCDEALKLLEQLNGDIEICKQKNYSIPEITNRDTNKAEKRISDIRKTAEQKDELCQRIYNNDTQMHNIASLSESTHEQWQEMIALCNDQAELLKECQKQQWLLPNIKYIAPDKTANKYKHYQTLIKLDSAISTEKTSLKTEKQYNIFFDNCSKQQTNIEICNKNEWSVPVLNNPNPLEILDAVRADKSKMDRARNNKKILIMFCAGLILALALTLTIYLSYINGKVRIPFDDSYISGQNLDTILEELTAAGFNNIHDPESLDSGWENSGKVYSVEINHSDTYKKGKYIDPKVDVIIKYYSEDRVYVTDLLKDWKNTDYNIIEQNLINEGFSNITIGGKKDTFEKDNDKKTAGLSLNGAEYKANEECYLPLNAPIVISYYNFKIEIGKTNTDFIGQDYEIVKSNLEEMGFKNVATLKIDTGWAKGNTVVGVTVDGSETYYSSTAFLPDAKVIIEYSSNDRIDVTKYFENLDEAEYTSVKSALEAMGFKVEVFSESTSVKSMNQLIDSININNEYYTGGECHIQKSTPIIITYYVLNIKIGKSASDFEKDQYSDVVADLKNKGFTNIQLKRADNINWANKAWTKGGTIKSITIGGNERFTDGAEFVYNTPIVIVVNTVKGEGYEDITDIV